MAKRLVNLKESGLQVLMDNTDELNRALMLLVQREVLVGYPEDTTDRPPDDNGLPTPVTNAALAYIHDNGAPEVNIPARPFMLPGIESVLEPITDTLAKAAQYALAGQTTKVEQGFERVGFLGVQGIQGAIRRGVPPPLADATLRERARRGRKGAQKELDRRAKGLPPGIELATPLMDTNEMLKSTNYVIRRRRNPVIGKLTGWKGK